MTVAFDAATASSEWRNPANGHADPFTFTHTPVGTPRGVVVFVIGSGSSSDFINGTVSYGGVALTRTTNGFASDTAGETGTSFCYFLGSGIPTGAQTVSIDYTGNTEGSFKKAICITLTAAADTVVAASAALSENVANPSVTLDSGAETAIRLLGLFTGAPNASVTLGGSLTSILAENAEGGSARSRQVARQTTPGSGSTSLGWTIVSDDVALTGVAVKESVSGSGSLTLQPVAVSGSGDHGTSATTGTGSLTLQPAAISGSGTETFSATGSVALAPATISGTGTGNDEVNGTGALTLQPVAVSGTALAGMVGTGAVTLQPVVISGSGTETLTATGALTLAPASVSGTGSETFTATGALTLLPASVSGSGTESMDATGVITLQPVTVTGAGDHTAPTNATGIGALTLSPLVIEGVGTAPVIEEATGGVPPRTPVPPRIVRAPAITGVGALSLPVLRVSGVGSVFVDDPWLFGWADEEDALLLAA